MVANLLASTGAPAFLDNDVGDDVGGSMDIILFATPYGLLDSILIVLHLMFSHHCHPVKRVLSDFQLGANGHDGFNAKGRLEHFLMDIVNCFVRS